MPAPLLRYISVPRLSTIASVLFLRYIEPLDKECFTMFVRKLLRWLLIALVSVIVLPTVARAQSAIGSTAPDVSLTVPAIALVCANAATGSIRSAAPNTMRANVRMPNIPPKIS